MATNMIGFGVNVMAGIVEEPGIVIGREEERGGGLVYCVKFNDGRVRAFSPVHVRVAVVPARPRPRLATVNGVAV